MTKVGLPRGRFSCSRLLRPRPLGRRCLSDGFLGARFPGDAFRGGLARRRRFIAVAMPYATSVSSDFLHRSPSVDRGRELGLDVEAGLGQFVAMFDEEPLRTRRISLHAHQDPAALGPAHLRCRRVRFQRPFGIMRDRRFPASVGRLRLRAANVGMPSRRRCSSFSLRLQPRELGG